MPPSAPSALHHVDLVNGKFERTSRGQLDEAFAAMQAAGRRHMVVHFHGGLVGRQDAWERIETLVPVYRDAGAWPMFFVWNSDLVTTVGRNLQEIAQEKIFRRLLRRVAWFSVGKLRERDDGRGQTVELDSWTRYSDDPEALQQTLLEQEAAGLGAADEELSDAQTRQLEDAIERDRVLQEEAQKIVNGQRSPQEVEADRLSRSPVVRGSTQTLMSPEIVEEMARGEDGDGARGIFATKVLIKHAVQIVARVVWRYAKDRHHGLYPTLVQETLRALYLANAGKLVWDAMKGDAGDPFREGAVYGGRAFVQQLGGAAPARVTLVGHSTGAVAITRFLRCADELLPADRKFDVVFLAAAASFDSMHDELDVLRRRVAGFRSFGLDDATESGYWEVPGIFQRSLLYMVSGMLEDEVDKPLVGMQRYFDGREAYALPKIQAVTEWMGPRNLIWSPTVPAVEDGWHCGADRHGGFDTDPKTLRSVKHLLTAGM